MKKSTGHFGMVLNRVDLVGDGIENPWNARTLIDAARMFGSTCYFRDRKRLADSFRKMDSSQTIQLVSHDQVVQKYSPVIALENLENAADLFAFKLAPSTNPVLIVGNEKYGISYDMRSAAEYVIQIPMTGPTLNTLNVATAAGVALFYLSAGIGARMPVRAHPQRRRPELLFVGGGDHVELGSAIRSAGAFGWERIFLDDRQKIWFGCDRVTRSEGRSAARRGRNAIRLVPTRQDSNFAFKEVLVVTRETGLPLQKADLAEGHNQLIAIPDESSIDIHREDWHKMAARVQYVKIEVPAETYNYHYRLFASIALAEVSRQVGQRLPARVPGRIKQGRVYDSTLAVLLSQKGELVLLDDLADY